MANVFKKAKSLRKKHPNKSWQSLVQMASKQTVKRKPAAKKKSRKVGAYKVIERGESKQTRPKKVVQVKRNAKGLYKGTVTVGSIKAHYQEKLKAALWEHEQATTVPKTKAAAKKIRDCRAMLRKL